MRMFLPIKGPGGRYLTPREKVALLILGLTLVLCALTLLAGDGAYETDATRNPVSAFVALLCRTFGGGIIALYALVLVWSGLIYFKGERVVDMRPLAGRLFATLCVTLGISGVLGIAHLETAGSLGLTVGAAIGNTFGATLGFPILIVLMLLGVHLAGQGAWSAMREPVRATGTATAPGGLGFGLKDAPQGRFAHPALPDDGDPSADERTLAITQAMEEIERSKGVTIVDVDPEEETAEETTAEEFGDRPSIGEEVDEVSGADDDSAEAEVRRVVAAVEEVLAGGPIIEDDVEDEAEEEAGETADEDYGSERHGFVPVPPDTAVSEDDECVEAVFVGDREEDDAEEEAEYEEEAPAFADTSDAEEYEDEDDEEALADEADDVEIYDNEAEDEAETDDDEEYEDEDAEADEYEGDDEEYDEEEADDDGETAEVDDEAQYDEEDVEEYDEEDDEAEYAEADDDDDDLVEDDVEEEAEPEIDAEPEDESVGDADPDEETAEAEEIESEDESYESVVAGQADGAGDEEEDEDDEDDPYAQGGLLRRLRHGTDTGGSRDGDDRPYTAFDWRGRPLE